MPTYEYECLDCGYRFEKFQQMTDKHLSKCPECAGKLRRLIGPGAGVIFKGKGFYETDYKRDYVRTRCGAERTCCGRDTPCDTPPCES
jgi:putative FmdB family regulatory protein